MSRSIWRDEAGKLLNPGKAFAKSFSSPESNQYFSDFGIVAVQMGFDRGWNHALEYAEAKYAERVIEVRNEAYEQAAKMVEDAVFTGSSSDFSPAGLIRALKVES